MCKDCVCARVCERQRERDFTSCRVWQELAAVRNSSWVDFLTRTPRLSSRLQLHSIVFSRSFFFVSLALTLFLPSLSLSNARAPASTPRAPSLSRYPMGPGGLRKDRFDCCRSDIKTCLISPRTHARTHSWPVKSKYELMTLHSHFLYCPGELDCARCARAEQTERSNGIWEQNVPDVNDGFRRSCRGDNG